MDRRHVVSWFVALACAIAAWPAAAAAHRRPRHLILVETARDLVADEDRAAVAGLRTALDAGELGAEGFNTSLRLGGRTITELKRIVFAPPPATA